MRARTLAGAINRRDFVKLGATAGVAVTAGLSHRAPTARAQAQDAAEQVLRMPAAALINPTGPFDLGLIGGGPGIQMANLMFEGLTIFDWNAQQVLPAAAERWEISPDNLTYTFFLRPGLVWSDGSPLVAGDYEYAIKRNLDPALGSPLSSYLYPLQGAQEYNSGENSDPNSVAVTATDDLTIEFRLTGITPYWPVMLALWTAFPINKTSIDAGGADWMQPQYLFTNGRYTMESWDADQQMTLVRNEQFHGEKPTVTRIEYTLFENPNEQALASFEAGELDTAPVSAANVDFVAGESTLSELRQQFPISGTWQLRLDMGNAASVLADVNVRKALYLAIDRELLASRVLKDVPTPTLVLTSPDIPSYDPNAALAGTVDDAKQYLADAGYPDGEGFPGFRLGYVPNQENAQLTCEALLQMWSDNLGITTASAFAVPTDWRQRIRTEAYDMYYGGWVSDFPDPYMWHNVIFDGDAWQSHWEDQAYLDMIRTAAVEPDLATRNTLYTEAEVYRIQDQMATIPLMVQGRLWVVQPWVQGLDVSPLDGPLIDINSVTIAEH